MNEFIKALHYDKKDPRIPEEYDFFGALVGEWNIEWVDHLEVDEPRRVKGDFLLGTRRGSHTRCFYCPLTLGAFAKQTARCRVRHHATYIQPSKLDVGYFLRLQGRGYPSDSSH